MSNIVNRRITEKQLLVYDEIIAFHKTERRFPTLREIGERLGVTAPTIHHHIKALIKKKYLVQHETGFVLGRIPSKLPRVGVIK